MSDLAPVFALIEKRWPAIGRYLKRNASMRRQFRDKLAKQSPEFLCRRLETAPHKFQQAAHVLAYLMTARPVGPIEAPCMRCKGYGLLEIYNPRSVIAWRRWKCGQGKKPTRIYTCVIACPCDRGELHPGAVYRFTDPTHVMYRARHERDLFAALEKDWSFSHGENE